VYDVEQARRIEDARVIMAARVSTPDAAATEIGDLCRGRSLTLVGDGAERYADVFRSHAPAATFSSPPPNLAAAAARLAARRRDEAGAPHALRPVYVRRPDAELARERARRAKTPALTCLEVSEASDVAAVAALQARAFGEAWGAEALGGAPDNRDVARLFAARLDGEIVGYCAGWHIADELHINSFAVAPEHRRRGIARALLGHVLSTAAASGATAATLEVRDSNRPGRALYEGLGFRVEGVRRGYYQHPREDALILWLRKLPPAPAGGAMPEDG
jgi:ribosomal-protein-alanine N-acetyltransferase